MQAIYRLLQAVVMVMLLLRLLSHVVVQPRLAIIAGTLGGAAPDLLHFFVGPSAVAVVLLGATMCVVFPFIDVSGGGMGCWR